MGDSRKWLKKKKKEYIIVVFKLFNYFTQSAGEDRYFSISLKKEYFISFKIIFISNLSKIRSAEYTERHKELPESLLINRSAVGVDTPGDEEEGNRRVYGIWYKRRRLSYCSFASDQNHYQVAFLTHSAHENLKGHLGAKGIAYFPISSPPIMPFHQDDDTGGSADMSFSLQKKEITRKHRQECVSVIERIYGEDPVMDGDLIFINFFALEGWSLAELFHVRCVVAAPYVVPYSAPTSFERQFRNELPLLYKYLREAPTGKIGWEDVIHWMWPLFTEDWGNWRSLDLKLSFLPFTDPVTDLPTWHDRSSSPLLLYGFSQEVVECPGYWPSAVRVCGFWSLPAEWQFSCGRCAEISSLISLRQWNAEENLCSSHAKLKSFLDSSAKHLIFISLSSVAWVTSKILRHFFRSLGML